MPTKNYHFLSQYTNQNYQGHRYLFHYLVLRCFLPLVFHGCIWGNIHKKPEEIYVAFYDICSLPFRRLRPGTAP